MSLPLDIMSVPAHTVLEIFLAYNFGLPQLPLGCTSRVVKDVEWADSLRAS